MIIDWSPEALERVEDIADWMAQRDEDAANAWIHELFERVDLLSGSPRSGRIVPEEQREDLREVIWKKYRIVYRLKDGKIEILTVSIPSKALT